MQLTRSKFKFLNIDYFQLPRYLPNKAFSHSYSRNRNRNRLLNQNFALKDIHVVVGHYLGEEDNDGHPSSNLSDGRFLANINFFEMYNLQDREGVTFLWKILSRII